jgi:hypothetical protein
MNEIQWGVSQIWNKSLEQREEKPVVARNRIWASELGKQDLDIYLKMMGIEPSNPFDSRSLRKFEAGNIFEWIVSIILKRCGIYKESQKWIGNTEFGLEVSGKLDHLAGGVPKYDQAITELKAFELPDIFTRATEQILAYFKETYPNGLQEQGIEVKSTSSYGIEKVYATGKALAGHDLQAFHYAYNLKIPFTVLYISKDDLRMAEIPILPDDKELLARYQNKIMMMAGYYNTKSEPKPEPPIVFEKDTERFSKNFNVAYSAYLTRNYKFQDQAEFDEKYDSIIMSWNRVITRLRDKKELTDNNKEKIAEMTEFGFDVMQLLNIKI